MTEKEIIMHLAGYYSLDLVKHEAPLTMTAKWVCERIDAKERDKLLLKVFETFIPTDKKPFPKIAEFNLCLEEPKENIEMKAAQAWARLRVLSNRYSSLVTDDYAVQAAIRAIGWIRFCDRTMDEEPFMRKDFIKLYCNAYGKETGVPAVFHGDLDNADSRPVYFGDPVKLKQIAADKPVFGLGFNADGQVVLAGKNK